MTGWTRLGWASCFLGALWVLGACATGVANNDSMDDGASPAADGAADGGGGGDSASDSTSRPDRVSGESSTPDAFGETGNDSGADSTSGADGTAPDAPGPTDALAPEAAVEAGDTTPPTMPTTLASTGATDASITLSWTASTDNVGVTGYKIFRNGAQVGTSPTASYVDMGLTASTMYTYTVSAYDAAGNDSARSAPLTVSTTAPPDTTPPTVPAGLTSTGVTNASITLSWTASTDNVGVTGYKIFRNGAVVGTSPTPGYTDSGLTASTRYTYTVSAHDAAGNDSAQSAQLVVSTTAPPDTTPPSVPTGLTSTGASDSSVSLSWVASTDNVGVTGYKIFRSGTAVGTSPTPSYTDSGLTASTMYSYTVTAYDAAANFSAPSAALSVSTTATPDTLPPSVPSLLKTTAITSTSISLAWTASTDNVGVTGYNVFRNGTQIGTSATASYSDTGLTVNAAYSYTVSAFDAAMNTSAQSVALAASTVDTTAPSVPTLLKTTAIASTSISLAWTASTDNVAVTGYKVFRNGTQVGTSATASYTDTGLAVATMYSYTVSAYDAAMNNSAQSAAVVATTVDTTAPTVPTALAQTASTSTSISLGWTASTDNVAVTGYKIFRNGTQVGTSATTMFTDTGLMGSTSYSYTVSAYDAAMNNSAPSTALSAMTSSCSINITKKTYSSTCDGYITYTNAGTGTETNPTLKFTLPSSEGSLDVSGSQCKVSGGLQTVPSSITAMTCSSSGTTFTYAFTGTLAKGAQIATYFTTNGSCSTTVPTNIAVAATSCP